MKINIKNLIIKATIIMLKFLFIIVVTTYVISLQFDFSMKELFDMIPFFVNQSIYSLKNEFSTLIICLFFLIFFSFFFFSFVGFFHIVFSMVEDLFEILKNAIKKNSFNYSNYVLHQKSSQLDWYVKFNDLVYS